MAPASIVMMSDLLSTSEESERLFALRQLRLLDTPPSESFDRVTRLAAIALGVPIALVSLVDESRQWFKSRYGIDATETARELSFCTHAVAKRDTLIVSDACGDDRFSSNPLVTGNPKIRFYAGVPLFTRDGHAIGTLCAIDRRPRDLNYEAIDILENCASIVQDLVQAHEMEIRMERLLDFAHERESLLENTIDSIPLGLICTSLSGKLRRVNAYAHRMLELRFGEPLRKSIAEIIHPDDWLASCQCIEAVASGSVEECRINARFQTNSSAYVIAVVSISLKRRRSGEPLCLLLILDTSTA